MRLQESNPHYAIWKEVQENPISKSFIDQLLTESWRVKYLDTGFISRGISYDQEIYLANDLTPLKRDITLFHELAHLRHPILLSSRFAANEKEKCEREIITEWLGRKARADPELLRHAVLSFSLEARIYDKSSYQAFQKIIRGQQCFPFIEQEYTVLMD